MTRSPRRFAAGFSACTLVSGSMLAVGVATAPIAQAAPAPIVKGAIAGGGGMKLLVLRSNGRASKITLPSSGAFSIPASLIGAGTSLHLVSSTGRYYGPLILRGNARNGAVAGSSVVYRFLTGAVPPAPKKPKNAQRVLNLGTFDKLSGYVRAKTALAPTYVQAAKPVQGAIASNGKPVGAGKLGRVAVAQNLMAMGMSSQANDSDRDGYVGAFDVDDNGNLVLDNVDRANRGGTMRSLGARDLNSQGLRMFSNYKSTSPDFSDVINVNVKVPTTDELDASVRQKTSLAVEAIPGGTLSCTGQVYCPGSPMPLVAGVTGDFQWQLATSAPDLLASQVNSGDTFLAAAGGQTYPGVLNFMFKTTPALKSYAIVDGQGNEGAPVDVDWQALGPKPGSTGAPIVVSPTAGEKVKLTFWRPQRQLIGDETGGTSGYLDIGGLTYKADSHPGFCAATPGDANGTAVQDGPVTVVRDNLGDGTPSADRTFSMIVDLANCPNNTNVTDIDIQAVSQFGDNSGQKIFFTRNDG